MADEGILYTSGQLTSTLINCIMQDHQGYIWVATQNGLNRFDGYRFTPYLYKKGVPGALCHNNVSTLYVDSDGRLWVGTAKGLVLYDARQDNFTPIPLLKGTDDQPRIACMTETADGDILIGTSGFGLYEVKHGTTTAHKIKRFEAGDEDGHYPALVVDSLGRLWRTGIDHVVYCFSSATDAKPKLLFKYALGSLQPFQLMRGEKGDIFAIGGEGFALFEHGGKTPIIVPSEGVRFNCACTTEGRELLLGTSGRGAIRYPADVNIPEALKIINRDIDFPTASVTTIFEDNQHNLWMGIDKRGLIFSGRRSLPFRSISLQSQGIKTSSFINSISLSANGGIWCAVRDGNLYCLEDKGNLIEQAVAPPKLSIIYRDRQGQQWLGAGQSIFRFNETTRQTSLAKTLDCAFIQSMTDDGNGTLYISSFGKGMTAYETRTGQIRTYSMFMRDNPRGFLCNDWVLAMFTDSKGLVWAATASGTSCYNPRKDSFKTFGWHNILEGYACLSLDEDREGNILIGTDRGLFVFNRQQNKTTPFNETDELGNKTIQAISCQDNGDIWISTSQGIWHYNHSRETLVAHISDNGLREREYSVGIKLKTADGDILFGNSEGLVAFKPEQVAMSQQKPNDIHLTALCIGGKPINVETLSNGDVITTEPVTQSRYFTLSYLDNSFTMEFSTFDFSNASNMVLEYKLNDDPFTENASGENVITFSHVQPGTYRLYVRAVQNGMYSATQAYTITIRAPWYRSTMAWVLYCLAFIMLIGYFSWRYYRNRQQQMAEEKMQFLINATHDIRTPLTLILSPLHKAMNIVKAENTANPQMSVLNAQLETIDHNARRILGLVNQILDIRKIDKQQMHLQCEQTAMVPFLYHIYKVFDTHAQERGIEFTFEQHQGVEAWIDRTQFDKVVQNLLSNAFKFTPDGGSIKMVLNIDKNHLTILVTDTGPGLREEDIPKLFTRFYQSAANQALGKEGTGIGLNLCKMIVEMHHGTIEARNRTDGVKGSEFIVTLPLGSTHLKPEELKPLAASQPANEPPTENKKSGGRRPRILLVDDDAEITDYIAGELSDQYRTGIANNGKEALSMLLAGDDEQYELVVSDIMMPEMDGFTLLRAIKSNLSIQHLPVILLTSEAAVGNRLQGLQQGADAFMAKPFIIDELRSQISNLLRKASVAKHRDTVEEEREKVEQRDVADNDKQLMERIMQSVNKNLGDSEFSVEQLASDAGLSRSQLHRKMKELTGISPSEFIRNIRLEQAARLLKERKVNVSQVAYTLGFNTLGTFSKVFKQHFGQTPTEYIAQD